MESYIFFCVLLVVTHKGFHATIVLGLYNKSWKQSHGNDKQCVIGKIRKIKGKTVT